MLKGPNDTYTYDGATYPSPWGLMEQVGLIGRNV